MDKNKKLIIALPILLLVSSSIWINLFKSSKPSSAKSQQLDIETLLDKNLTLRLAAQLKEPERQAVKSRFANWSRNPFDLVKKEKPPQDAAAVTEEPKAVIPDNPPDQLNLSGIFWNQDKSTALINNEVVKVGSQMESYTIVDIKKDTVIVTNGRRAFELKMGE